MDYIIELQKDILMQLFKKDHIYFTFFKDFSSFDNFYKSLIKLDFNENIYLFIKKYYLKEFYFIKKFKNIKLIVCDKYNYEDSLKFCKESATFIDTSLTFCNKDLFYKVNNYIIYDILFNNKILLYINKDCEGEYNDFSFKNNFISNKIIHLRKDSYDIAKQINNYETIDRFYLDHKKFISLLNDQELLLIKNQYKSIEYKNLKSKVCSSLIFKPWRWIASNKELSVTTL